MKKRINMKTLKQDLYNMKKENSFLKQISSKPKPMDPKSFLTTIDLSNLISVGASNIYLRTQITDNTNGD